MEQQLELTEAKIHNNFVAETLINHKAARNTQHDRLLALLQKHKGQWVALPEILTLGIAQYNARIFDLRAMGYNILNRCEREAGVKHSWFMLI